MSNTSGRAPQVSRQVALTSIVVLAFQTLALQILALVALAPAQFGMFSIQYLIFALASSFLLSFVSDAWVRTGRHLESFSPWSTFSSTAAHVSIGFGLVCVFASVLTGMGTAPLLLGSIAVIASSYRGCVRFHHVYSGDGRSVLVPEIAGLAVFLATCGGVVMLSTVDLTTLTLIWACSSGVTALLSRGTRPTHPRVVSVWYREHRQQIKPLLRDSLLMDVGAVGTPFILAPALGISAFGTYRAVSNVASPVRLILNPLRPQLASGSIRRWVNRRAIVAVGLAATLAGAAAFICLRLIETWDLRLGTLGSLAPYAAPTSAFVVSSVIGTYFYILIRPRAGGRPILFGRVVQTLAAVAGPLCGYLTAGLGGAIWGLATATGISALTWFAIASLTARTTVLSEFASADPHRSPDE